MKNLYGLVKLLLKFGCNEYLKDNYARTPLHYAAMKSSNTIVRCLVERNTFLEYKSHESVELTKEFLNAQDAYGRTALHYACKHNQIDNVVTIIKSGIASVNFFDYNSQTALEIVYENENWDLFEKLVKHKVCVSSRLMREICARNQTNLIKAIFREPDLNSFEIDENGNSLLYWAVKYSNSIETACVLIESSLKFNEKDFIDFIDVLEGVEISKQSSNETNTNKGDQALYFIEIIILMLKHGFFSRHSDTIHLVRMFTAILSICAKHTKYSDRLFYMFALAIYSKQMVITNHQPHKLFIESASKSKGQKLNLNQLILDATRNPWSLQMSARIVIRNHSNLAKNLPANLPDIYVKYLNFDYI
jgi:ankyrin repeat protein